jgi:SlyX protein
MTSTTHELIARLDDLESRFAFLVEMIGVLNPQVAQQEKRLASVEESLRALRNELAALRTALSHDAASEAPPPHF